MRKLILSLKIIIILIIIHLSCFSSVFSQDPFIITNNTLKIIPTRHLSFLEGYDETVTFDKLENSKGFDDVAGMDELKEMINSEIIIPLTQNDIYEKLPDVLNKFRPYENKY